MCWGGVCLYCWGGGVCLFVFLPVSKDLVVVSLLVVVASVDVQATNRNKLRKRLEKVSSVSCRGKESREASKVERMTLEEIKRHVDNDHTYLRRLQCTFESGLSCACCRSL
jgi:hypothetical protein